MKFRTFMKWAAALICLVIIALMIGRVSILRIYAFLAVFVLAGLGIGLVTAYFLTARKSKKMKNPVLRKEEPLPVTGTLEVVESKDVLLYSEEKRYEYQHGTDSQYSDYYYRDRYYESRSSAMHSLSRSSHSGSGSGRSSHSSSGSGSSHAGSSGIGHIGSSGISGGNSRGGHGGKF